MGDEVSFRHVCFLNAGSCTQWGYLAGRKTRRLVDFPAVFVHLDHPVHGQALIDTGYSPHFRDATRPFPQRFYRWLTPVRFPPEQHARGVLERHGLNPDEVGKVFVSHFHGDHIAGLRHFPAARFVYRGESLRRLMGESSVAQVRHAFLPALLPTDFVERGEPITEEAFQPGGELGGLRVFDYWGDGDLLLVDLPGHADGHTGYLIRTDTGPLFYIVDACWDVEGMLAGRPLPRLSLALQHSKTDYLRTQDQLRRLAGDFPLLACHCPRTQQHVVGG
jgi:glyoxylase-like metal-dependent hydrolase (beta-lactamase superfamily II)